MNYIREQSGKHFDPHIVDAFLSMVVKRKSNGSGVGKIPPAPLEKGEKDHAK